MSADGTARTFAVHAACIHGVEAFPVTVEVSSSGGIPNMVVIGNPDGTVLDGRGRIRCAIRTSGYDVPRAGITVSLAPGDIRKTGSGLDLPIAIAVLAISNQIPREGLDGCLFVGEVALDGRVTGVRGEVAYQLLARDMGLAFIGGASDAHTPLAGVDCGVLTHLGRLRAGIEAARESPHAAPSRDDAVSPKLDFSDVIGQEIAKRGIVVAATGDLGLLMIGAPGSGKSMLARRMSTILPPIDEQERQEALCIHSVAGEPTDALLRGERPFRRPHHSSSTAGLIGGGRPVRPGEASLAHGGILFLDELGEFSNNSLQTLRQPIEEGCVRLMRADGAYIFPSRFRLLAASNPCPCGYLGDREIPCRCAPGAIERYQAKLGGPLADRIDLIIDVCRPDPALLVDGAMGQSTKELKGDVERGRAFRRWRCARRDSDAAEQGNGSLDAAVDSFALDDGGAETLLAVARGNHLTGRGIIRLCRIARTVADMAESERVTSGHVLEGSMLQGRRSGEHG